MEETFIVCCKSSFTKEISNVHVTTDRENALFIANYEKDENKYDTYWIEVWNEHGMTVRWEEKDFLRDEEYFED